MDFKIPDEFNLGGSNIKVNIVDRCDNNALGTCLLAEGCINIAENQEENKTNKDNKQNSNVKVNTFFHELTHAILDTMGEVELSGNEKFVCCFSSFLTEAINSFKYNNK